MGHPDDLRPFFGTPRSWLDILKPCRILQRRDGVEEIDAVLAPVRAGLGVVPFVVH